MPTFIHFRGLKATRPTLHNFLHNPRLLPLPCGIIGDFFDAVWRNERGAAMQDIEISGRIRGGCGLNTVVP
jgi:hypothetical protein